MTAGSPAGPAGPAGPTSPFDGLIDPSIDEPNVAGLPLFLLSPSALSNEDRATVVELWARARAHEKLEGYARYVMGIEPALHHKLLCEALEALVADEYDDLIINMPPGGAKTTYAFVAFTSWLLGKRPEWQVLGATHSAKLVEQVGRRIRDIVADAPYRRVFDIGLSESSAAAMRWETTAGGQFYGVGAGASILGYRADMIVMDDVVGGIEVANSMEQLAKLHEWYENDLITRLKPHGKIVLICQRLNANDMAGYMINRHAENPTRRLKVIKFKMEAEGTPENPDPLGRQPGETLWPEWFTPEWVADCKRDDYKWRTLYQQEPPSETGSWVNADDLHLVEQSTLPPPGGDNSLNHYLLSDLALSVNSGDYSVHLVAGVDHLGHVTVVDAWRARVSPEVTAARHLDLCAAYKPVESLIDDDNMAKVYVQLLASQARAQSISVPWKTMPMRGQDKETRAAALRGMFKSRRISFVRAEWNRWLFKELLGFPNLMGEGVDDGVDALGLIGRRLASLSRASAPPSAPAPAKTWHNATLQELFDDNELKRGTRARM